jgi:very-short-patch-repair endonuclease
LWSLPAIDQCTEITVVAGHALRLKGVEVYRTIRLEAGDIKRRQQIPVTSLPRTIVDLSSVVGRDNLVAVVDHVLAKRRVPLSLIQGTLEALGTKGRRGAGVLADILDERRGRKRHADSEPQRILQAALEARALKAEYEYEIRLPGGTSVFADVAFPRRRLIVEVNSYEHHASFTDWAHDQARTSALVALGWRVLVVTTYEIRENVQRVAARIAGALAA